jgi:hypothetical protein
LKGLASVGRDAVLEWPDRTSVTASTSAAKPNAGRRNVGKA